MMRTPEDLESQALLDKLSPEAFHEAITRASREELEDSCRNLFGLLARTGIDLIQADRRFLALQDEMLQAQGKLARAGQLAEAWKRHARGCHDLMKAEEAIHERGRWLGCAVQAHGCAEDLDRLLKS